MGEIYDKNTDKWMKGKVFGHKYLEKPAMYSQLPNLENKKVLCLGCGAGEECEYLRKKGAKVIGIDISKELIKMAKQKFPKIEFYVMGMQKLNFAKSKFDFIYSSLVLHYVKNWIPVLKKIKKVLKKKGLFLFSTHNPVCWGAEKVKDGKCSWRIIGLHKDSNKKYKAYGNYLETKKINDTWFDSFKITYYHKPFYKMINEIIGSGLEIVDCLEPKCLEKLKKIDKNKYEKYSKVPLFVIFKLMKK